MTDATLAEETETPRSSKLPIVIGLVLALVGGGGGFFAASKGLILVPESKADQTHGTEAVVPPALADLAFIPMEPLTISMPRTSRYAHLRFRGELEVSKAHVAEVQTILPRLVDVLNSYLRALEVSDIEEPASLARLRSQMLRRVQVVAGPGRINDLLIMEFVLN